ncbi:MULTISPECIES: DUF3947 family protein [Bacillus]|uniref:DUF3947 family protein n=1 Tax=Bacillus TaxID=1386 RepID=UPI001145D8FF|nr:MULTISPECIES: DUF3947 family protein [Bacillus]
MINHYFDNGRQVASAITAAGAQATIHAVYQAMQHNHHLFLQYYHHPVHVVHPGIYLTHFSAIPFGSTYTM